MKMKNVEIRRDGQTETLQVEAPKGFDIVTTGEVVAGDMLWDEEEGWGPAVGEEIGRNVCGFKCTARRRKA